MPWSSASSEPNVAQAARPLLGTLVTIRGESQHESPRPAIERAFTLIANIERRMSFHRAESELSQINRRAAHEAVPLSPPLRRVMHCSLALARASDGLFDPSIAADLVRWGQLPPPEQTIPAAGASWKDIELDGAGRIRFHRPLWIDLGGIAKGYAVDCAIAALRSAGLRSATVNAGGDLRSFGHEHTVWVRDPAQPVRQIALLQVRNVAVATSAGYFSLHRGRTALVDPRMRRSRGRRVSITVCAPRAIWADALTKVVLLAGDAQSTALLRRLRAHAMCIDTRGQQRRVA